MNIDKIFGAANGYPGNQVGMSLDQAREMTILQKKIFGQRFNLVTGTNPENLLNLPKDGRMLRGISLYYPYSSTIDNPELNLKINNSLFIVNVGFRTIDIDSLMSSQYYELNLPLSGNDEIVLDFNQVLSNSKVQIQIHYI